MFELYNLTTDETIISDLTLQQARALRSERADFWNIGIRPAHYHHVN